MSGQLLAVGSIWQRELTRFYRQRNRVASALGAPLLMWFMIGSGFGDSFTLPSVRDMSYLEYFYPGMVTLGVLFTSVFSAMSVIEDRRDGFLQGVLAAPVSRASMVIGKALGGTSQAFIQSVILLIALPFFGVELSWLQFAAILGALALMSFALTTFGFAMAWRMDSTQGYHGVMNLLLMPMWLLSGAMFPLTTAPGWVHALMRLNPMTYALATLRASFYGAETAAAMTGVSMVAAFGVSAAFGVLAFAAAVFNARRT